MIMNQQSHAIAIILTIAQPCLAPPFLSTSHCEFYGARRVPKPDESFSA